MKDVEPNSKEIYSFLCESCHPSSLRLFNWILKDQNWDNLIFNEKTHNLIERTFKSMEKAIEGISYDGKKLLELAIPYIEKDQKK